MKVIFHKDFHHSYVADPAAATGRVEAVLKAIRRKAELVEAVPADREDIAAVHTPSHIEEVRRERLYDIAALAAGGAIQAALTGLTEPCFALIRPPGHHASAGSAWGFCYFNNMAIALEKLKHEGLIDKAHILDFDLHFGDGTVNILGGRGYVTIHNPSAAERTMYLREVEQKLFAEKVDLIGVSAGFDNHLEDWGGLLATEDYRKMGKMVRRAAREHGGGCFGILEGGYNHSVLGQNVLAFIEGMEEG
ncbi:MAG: acetylpolyamine aminohydrolase [Deltaproteobacteria bacterium HGW-Deltaproteobacteria-19]|jgi:acetoin utilization deacetylase AcuC-like enzyme|nr:MAG: acetylpolyamine aminohydrolase [Deltaproteobacteria bacterium HGW-Deltaproteobacteria-19]